MTAVPYTTPATWPDVRPGRLAAQLRRDASEDCRCALLGLPDDLGVQLNGGRTGAREGPRAFRAALARFGVAWDGLTERSLDVGIFDAGDVEPATGSDEAALLETHRRVEAAVAALRARGLITLCVGGGHDLTLPAVRAAAKIAGAPLGGINFDAHLDVRAKVGSGMAFRRLIEGGHVEGFRFAEVGLGRFVNDRADLDWLRAQGATLRFAEEDLDLELGLEASRLLDLVCDGPAFLSIDIDGIDQMSAPGASAPAPLGMTLRDAARLAEAAGARREIVHFDLMEFNPSFDVDGRTARVLCLLLLRFLAGLARRSA